MEPLEQNHEMNQRYELDYEIKDVMLAEPFVVMKPVGKGRPNWWSDRVKVGQLIYAFKRDMTVKDACMYAGITIDQYKYFCKIHPTFYTAKARFECFLPMMAKEGLVRDIESPNGSRARMWYLERTQPEIYGKNRAYKPYPPKSVAKGTTDAFLDEEDTVSNTEGAD